jgi:hypothetical protein
MLITRAVSLAIAMAPQQVSPANRPGTPVDTIVRMIGEPIHRGVGRLELIATVPATGPGSEFIYMTDATLDQHGSLIVVDERTPVVREFDSTGRFVRQIGGKGRGPGEYLLPRGVAVLPDGRIAIQDNINRRINIYSADGRPIAVWKDRVRNGINGGSLLDDRGSLIAVYPLPHPRPSPSDRVIPDPLEYVRYSLDGSVTSTLSQPAVPGESPSSRYGGVFGSTPFAPQAHVDWSPLGYFVTSYSDRFSIELHPPGNKVISLRRSFSPVQVSNGERKAAEAKVDMFRRRAKPGDPILPGPPVPDTKPAFKRLNVDRDGRIWVWLYSAARPTGPINPRAPLARWVEPRLVDIIEPSGRYIGRISVPPGGDGADNILFRATTGSEVWTTSGDDDGFWHLNKYHIVW